MSDFMIYGATGYTGSLIAREAVRRDLRPVLAGRNAENLATLASEIRLDYRVFTLDVPEIIDDRIRGIHTLLNCAGPFSHTAAPLAEACLRAGIHYLDITGEAGVIEGLGERYAQREQRASSSYQQLDSMSFRRTAWQSTSGTGCRRRPDWPSASDRVAVFLRGTALTAIERIADGGLVRENGVLKRVPAAWKTRVIDFGDGPVRAITIPWGDVATAFYSTGIPNIEVYLAASWGLRVCARVSRRLGWLLHSRMVQSRLRRHPRRSAGPD